MTLSMAKNVTLIITTLDITTLDTVLAKCCYADCCKYAYHAECHYAECHHAECHGTKTENVSDIKRCFSLLGSGPTRKHWTRLERLATVEHSSLLQTLINYFHNIGPWGQSHKKFLA